MPQSNSAHVLQLLNLCSGACALQQEKPPQWEARAPQPESSPCSPQLEKAHTATKTQQANINKFKKKKERK